MNTPLRNLILGLALAATAVLANAQEALIRKNLAAHLPDLPAIDEVRKTPMPGLYEVRINGTDLFYTNADGNYLIQGGNLVDVKTRSNLTMERVSQLTAVSFNTLPVKDAFTIVRGNGKRQLAVFEDPNCGYCKQFERDLQKVDNVTIHLFLYPILGGDSPEKSKNIWCAKEPGKVWQDWMVREQKIAAVPLGAPCDTGPIQRNLAFGQKYRLTGTPTLIFADGTRIPGALPADEVEKQLRKATL
jgi:thiol:disulfide interchange protein DsbC